jgi:hypothetical protein
LYLPEPQILHLKAPMGGFRTEAFIKMAARWIQPETFSDGYVSNEAQYKQQILGYKTTLFFKYYNRQQIKINSLFD